MEVRLEDRKSGVLTPSDLPCLSKQPTVNLTRGCAIGCVYCYAQGYSGYPGDDMVVLYRNVAEKIRAELPRKRKRPSRVFFSPSTDAFQPIPELHELAYEVFEYLLGNKINISFSTKGVIPDPFFDLFERHSELVQAQMGITTMDEYVASMVEPNAALPMVRLAQVRRLKATGVTTEVRVDPILPGLTDDEKSLEVLFKALASVEVKHAALNILYLRPAIRGAIKRKITDPDILQRLLRHYESQVRVSTSGGKWTQDALPESERKVIFDRAIKIAKQYEIGARICGCMNNDMLSGNCNLGGRWTGNSKLAKEVQSEFKEELFD